MAVIKNDNVPFCLFLKSIGIRIIPVRTMFAPAFAAIPALQMVFFREHEKSGGIEIEIFRV